MGRIADLRKDVTKMTTQEKLDLIRGIRKDRKIIRNPVAEKKTKAKKATDLDKLKKQLAGFTPEQLKAMGLV